MHRREDANPLPFDQHPSGALFLLLRRDSTTAMRMRHRLGDRHAISWSGDVPIKTKIDVPKNGAAD